ncbi:hypothetical protein DFH06DRAFT_1000455 [Mycena polygramma]|nr:hypothetical protein DFH06DRAFT_1000455 [Mycena polygramma]
MASSTHAIILNFQNIIRVAGETIAGTVDLNVALAQEHHIEHVQIGLRGLIKTYVAHTDTETLKLEDLPQLVYSNLSLWTQGSAFPATRSHVLSLPFQFQLRANLPPSFHCDDDPPSRRGTISYSLEVVGARPGRFRVDRRIGRVFSVLPAASQSQMLAKESLRQGWVGPWRNITQADRLRHGIWGEYSRAHATLSIPNLHSFPVATPVPYSLHVVTETRTMTHSDRPEDKHGKPLFPAPPTQASRLTMRLWRKATIRAGKETEYVEDSFHLQGTSHFGDAKPVTRPHVQYPVVVDQPVWIPNDEKDEKNGRGSWRRAVHFSFTLAFPFAPTFSTEIIEWAYTLQVLVSFPGLGNDLKLEVPINLCPGSACPPPPIGAAGTSSLTYADVLPAGPPPMLDLPPCVSSVSENIDANQKHSSYWAGEDHDWDEKR